MYRITMSIISLILLAATVLPATAQDSENIAEKVDAAKQAELINIVKNATVTVQYKLKYDKGQSPEVYDGCITVGSGCSSYAANLGGASPEQCLEQERTFDVAGILISPTEVIIPDLMIHERFIESVTINAGNKVIDAKLSAICADRPAAIIEAAEAISSVEPLEFVTSESDKLFAVYTAEKNGIWSFGISPWSESVSLGVNGTELKAPPVCSVIVDADGKAVALNYQRSLPLGGSWKVSPKSWPFISAGRLAELKESVQNVFSESVMRVRLGLRSPKQDQSQRGYYGGDSNEQATEMQLLGAIVDPTHILVIADLQPKVTARLENITVYPTGSEPIEAKFVSSFKDYGCFLAELDNPIGQAVNVSSAKLSDLFLDILIGIEVSVQGENVDVKTTHRRIISQQKSFRGNLEPALEASDTTLLVYDLDGSLVALPSVRREKNPDEYNYRYKDHTFLAAIELAELFTVSEDMSEYYDLSNVPLSEEQELRLSWLGVELQPLDQELARINKVSSFTDDGSFGCLVSYVYPNSPAKAAGLKLGDVLISMYSDKWPQPVNVTLEEYVDPSYFMQLWEHMDEIPEEYFERIPRPWPSAENTVTRAITDLGFGETFKLDYARRGEVTTHTFTVEQSPAHYDMANKYKDESLGMTVRDMSYEVRRYFQRPEGKPGVIVSKVEPGSRASVSGVKPYEIITHVNNQPVMNSSEFKAIVTSGEELTLQIKRMTKGRVASIRSLPADEKAESKPEAASE